MIRAALQYSHRDGYQAVLERDLERAGIPVIHDVDPQFSWKRQLLWTRDVGRQYPDDFLIVLDAWDQILLGTKAEIEALDLKGVTLAGARNCWPNPERIMDFYRKRGIFASPWQFINNSPTAGLGRDIADAIDWGWERYPMKSDHKVCGGDDVPEQFWTNVYLASPLDIRIDTHCQLNQILMSARPGDLRIENGRVHNTITGSKPIFLHANAGLIVPDGLIQP